MISVQHVLRKRAVDILGVLPRAIGCALSAGSRTRPICSGVTGLSVSAKSPVGEAAFVARQQKSSESLLRISVMVPQIGDRSDFTALITVLVGGAPVTERTALELGEFSLEIPVPATQVKRRVDPRFSSTQRLPDGVNRVVVALLRHIGWHPAPVGRTMQQ